MNYLQLDFQSFIYLTSHFYICLNEVFIIMNRITFMDKSLIKFTLKNS